MSTHPEPPGDLPAVTTCIEMYGGRPVTIRDREVAADFIIDHFPSIAAVHTAPLHRLPQTANSVTKEEAATDG